MAPAGRARLHLFTRTRKEMTGSSLAWAERTRVDRGAILPSGHHAVLVLRSPRKILDEEPAHRSQGDEDKQEYARARAGSRRRVGCPARVDLALIRHDGADAFSGWFPGTWRAR